MPTAKVNFRLGKRPRSQGRDPKKNQGGKRSVKKWGTENFSDWAKPEKEGFVMVQERLSREFGDTRLRNLENARTIKEWGSIGAEKGG